MSLCMKWHDMVHGRMGVHRTRGDGSSFSFWQIETSPWQYWNWCIAAQWRQVREKCCSAHVFEKFTGSIKKKISFFLPLTHTIRPAWPLDRTLNSSHLGLIIHFTEREVSKRKWLNYRPKLAMEKVGCLVCACWEAGWLNALIGWLVKRASWLIG